VTFRKQRRANVRSSRANEKDGDGDGEPHLESERWEGMGYFVEEEGTGSRRMMR